MKSIIQQIATKNKEREAQAAKARQAEIDHPTTSDNRRSFLKKTALGGIAMTSLLGLTFEDTIAQTTSKVQKASAPSDLKITDLRYCVTTVLGRTAIIRIDTNQGIYGLGEVRDGADPRYALMLKSRILGENPCNVEKIFKIVKQFGGPARQAGGVCGVEMALWDLCGKAYNVPAWQLLGGRYRDSIRIYADTPEAKSPEEQLKLIKYRTEEQGYSWLKMDVSINEIKDIPGALINANVLKQGSNQFQGGYMSYANTQHPFTGIQITEKGLEALGMIVERVRSMVGYEIPLSTDHYGHFDLNNIIRLGKTLEKYRLAWLEDTVPWQYTEQLKTISNALDTPLLTGEDIYLLENFKPIIDGHAVDIIHPDLATSGGLLETKRIGDYAEEKGIAMAMHQAGTPVSFMANVHCAAATQNFLALEHHSVDLPWWEGLVKTTDGRKLIDKGYAPVPLTAPGLGIELVDEEVKKHLHASDTTYFAPTKDWDERRSHDRTYS
ncbi:MAG: mandelate racemase/muconate lactonizing enzyme family protein [Saprospiraceae bacterium]|jgi:L-alanine-DL-glutamate epimerase-like enolase superfamily enzyme|nr:mandelate racemase/muconate lactonizing enzyme family protein [Saprospiraceae bacterium]MBK6476864.1 mandelate racemase/muconate lactonizing enzyme family protein [Saprospiraceae bacterium]MBK6816109.1 mandelate racemase/muconate lactonizing enzyme family protein [Saprospiraceae bacterium]MBK7370224.1 mandelate racemase/muconate lactonizing enzyme family protein [Saprospiraceae bacterium]MBK8280832.1 mandelate racemase/muconate lactonizing enzyme family protein [Saprospiraceae bacterium]